MADRSFLRFEGRLWEDMTFERRAGWETERIAHRPAKGDGEYMLELLDGDGRVLVDTPPRVDFEYFQDARPTEMRVAPVCAYLPLHPDARRMVFRRGELILVEDNVAPEPPEVTKVTVKRGKRALDVSWTALRRGDTPLTFTVTYLPESKRGLVLARGLEKRSLSVELGRLPGGREARMAVMASDGVRSGFAVSEPFAVKEPPAQIWIQSPDDEVVHPPDQPLSLVGQATDVAGAALPDDALVWYVDRKVVAKGERMAVAGPLEPGLHAISLRHGAAEGTIRVTVGERSKEHARHREIMEAQEPGG